MESVDEIYGGAGNFLNAEQLKTLKLQNKPLKISSVETQDIGRDEATRKKKIVIGFEGQDKSLVLNKTNAKTLEDAFGNDPEKWNGNTIRLVLTLRSFQGTMVPAIAIMI